MSLANIVSSKGEKLRRELLKAEFSKEDKQKASKVINNSGSGNISKYVPRYFKIDWDVADTSWGMLLSLESKSLSIASTCKIIIAYNNIVINTAGSMNNVTPIAFSYLPIYVSQIVIDNYNLDIKAGLKITIEEALEAVKAILVSNNVQVNLSMEGITEITEDEYYKID